ncbi:hypothetical protein FQN50_008270 [Emmonsiellopsis sp. PD_5]|nr:hypothetical protein FQN50_008270 [Emmonsiellopsis sp. PD_5]
MAAAGGGVNFVRIFFYDGNTISPARKKSLVALAYATARAQVLAPKAILIRADLHRTTKIDGKYVQDPKGWHGTFAFKTEDHIGQEFHVACHGYTKDKEDFVLKEAEHTDAKADGTNRGKDRIVWPADDELIEYMGYSHLPEGN